MDRLRKTIKVFSVLFALLTCGCRENRRVDIIFECKYYAQLDNVKYSLTVERISEKEFNNANGINVVKDVVAKHAFFFISLFSYKVENDNIIKIEDFSFLNLRDAYESKAIPVSYIDDSNNFFTPRCYYKGDENPSYYILYNEIHLIFERKI